MASATDSARNDEGDLALTWSGRWTLTHRILAVNLLTLVLFALSIAAFPEELPVETVRAVFDAAAAKVQEAMGIEGRIGMEDRGSSSARASWSPSDHTGGHTGSPIRPW